MHPGICALNYYYYLKNNIITIINISIVTIIIISITSSLLQLFALIFFWFLLIYIFKSSIIPLSATRCTSVRTSRRGQKLIQMSAQHSRVICALKCELICWNVSGSKAVNVYWLCLQTYARCTGDVILLASLPPLNKSMQGNSACAVNSM